MRLSDALLGTADGMSPREVARRISRNVERSVEVGPNKDCRAVWRSSPWRGPLSRLAQRGLIDLAILEDGLLRGPGAWMRRAPRLSVVVGEIVGRPAAFPSPSGILEKEDCSKPELLARARGAMRDLVALRLGGDCWRADSGLSAIAPAGRASALLVLQEKYGSQSPANAAAARRMLAHARVSLDPGRVLVVAPDARPGSREWRRAAALAAEQGWRFIDRCVSPWTLLDGAGSILTLGHEIGLLGLVRGLPVHCFGRPFYAGWGATLDDAAVASRGALRTPEEIFAAACLLATKYFDPFTGREGAFEQACALLAEWRRRNETNKTISAVVGVSFWKRRRIRDLLSSTEGAPVFARRPSTAVAIARKRGGAVAFWTSREPPELSALARQSQVPLIQIEDGFLRSVGLGADFIPGLSIVADRQGIYFDPSKPSDFETLMNETVFDQALLDRARRLAGELARRGVTKYNVGGALPRIDAPVGVRRIFVPGQVEDDRSVLLGGAGVLGNLDLLKRVPPRQSRRFHPLQAAPRRCCWPPAGRGARGAGAPSRRPNHTPGLRRRNPRGGRRGAYDQFALRL